MECNINFKVEIDRMKDKMVRELESGNDVILKPYPKELRLQSAKIKAIK